jgi:hypothetical protein
MKIAVGDRIEYWAGLGGSRLKEGVVKRIEAQVGVVGGVPIEGAPVSSWDTEDENRGAFVDLADGHWTYASRVVKVVARA